MSIFTKYLTFAFTFQLAAPLLHVPPLNSRPALVPPMILTTRPLLTLPKLPTAPLLLFSPARMP